jgi:hypothetical protein
MSEPIIVARQDRASRAIGPLERRGHLFRHSEPSRYSGDESTAIPAEALAASGGGFLGGLNDAIFGSTGPRGGRRDGVVQIAARGAIRTIARELTRGLLGSLLGSNRR